MKRVYIIRDGKVVEKESGKFDVAGLAPTVGAEHKAMVEVTVRQLERQGDGRRL